MTTPIRQTLVFLSLPLLLASSIGHAALSARIVCPTRGELRAKTAACNFGTDNYKDENQCPNIRCAEPKTRCPSSEEVTKQTKICQDQGSTATLIFDGICQVVSCSGSEKVETKAACSKVVTREGCVQINCLDGYAYDSCKEKMQCDAEPGETICRKFIDADGCDVVKCGDKLEKSCPNFESKPKATNVTCEIIKQEIGCHVKKCSDGTYLRECRKTDKVEDFRSEKPSRRVLIQQQENSSLKNRGTRIGGSSSSSSAQ